MTAAYGDRSWAIVAGLFGKLPARGDFVRLGWPDEVIEPLDRWLSGTMTMARDLCDDGTLATWMREAPPWRGYVPPGVVAAPALHVAICASIDRAGRFFPLTVGVCGEPRAVWSHATEAGAALAAMLHDLVAGRLTPENAVAGIAEPVAAADGATTPATSLWWCEGTDQPPLASDRVDAALLHRLMSMVPA